MKSLKKFKIIDCFGQALTMTEGGRHCRILLHHYIPSNDKK
ncbi:hypothetical protein [Helicobacter sp.]|nr:hypothetical protein [Helicobacter sp.]MDY5557856.1 hypothetical protein [Helicobacter sp.]